MTLMGVVDGQNTSRSPGLSDQLVEKKKKKEDKKATSSKSVKPDKSVKSSSHRPPPSDSTDQKLEVMEQKWSDRFNRLEALLLAKTLDRPQEPVFTAVKVAPTHAPPINVISTEPFLKPSDQPSHRTSTTTLPATDPASSATASKAGSDISPPSQRPGTSRVSDQSTVQKHLSGAFDVSRKDTSSSESDADSATSDWPPVDLYPEEGELSDDHDVSFTDPDQSLSEEQSYRETMRGFGHTWGGTTYLTWTQALSHQMTTPLLGQNYRHQGKFLSPYPPTSGYATS